MASKSLWSILNIQKYATVFINPDEPVEIRRAKAIFRRIGYKARQDGKLVMIRDDWIKIDEDVYKISDIDKIPSKYQIDQNAGSKPNADTSDNIPSVSTTDDQALGGARPKNTFVAQPASSSTTTTRLRKVKIRLTEAGFCFSGPSAYLSHMYRAPFVYQETPYSSVEQGYHHIHAEVEGELELAAKIMKIHDGYDLKDAAANLPRSEKWAAMAPGKVWELNEAKFGQNPDLFQQLLDTAPHKLIEASVDSKWGGGACPFTSDINDQSIVPGANLCGEQLTKYRDDTLAERATYSMS